MLRLFRRKTKEQAPEQAAAPEPIQTSAPTRPGAESDSTADGKPKRRRGSRGGRGRRKPATAAATGADQKPADAKAAAKPAGQTAKTAKGEKADKPERKPARSERKPAERKRAGSTRRRIEPRRAALPPAKRELLVSVDVGEQRVAVLEDDKVAEVYLERPERRSIAGNIYLGVVDNVLPGMEAAFIEIGLEKNGFLFVDEIVVPELEGKARHGKRIQDLIQRGQTILVQAVKDPMKTKGARLTTEISLPGRFVVYVPTGEGYGVSRRLPDEERARLKEIIKALDLGGGGLIVRTAAEGASAEDIERDLVFLQRLWKTIQTRAKQAKAPALVYQEAELPLRVVRDLFTGDFERALVDNDRAFKRIVGYLRKTSPHMVERVIRYKDKAPLFDASGVDAQIRSTLSRRVDLPSGGYLIFDYAEAFTVIDVNTGRFVGSRGKGSSGRLEDTITKNNLEAVKEVVRQLRLRDIGGIIVIDFIDMANPKNRELVEGALKTELERDRTKTYVVEISPLGLVEMTRQNVTEGPREILTKRCATCEGEGVILSEESVGIEMERRLRALAAPGARTQAFKVALHPKVASLIAGPAAERLAELEAQTRRRFLLEGADGVALDHFQVVSEGKLEDLRPEAPVEEGQELELKLVEVGRHDATAGVGKVDGFDVCVGRAAKLVGKKVRVRIERILDGTAYAASLDEVRPDEPITAESEAEKPTRQPRAKKTGGEPIADAAVAAAEEEAEEESEPEIGAVTVSADPGGEEAAPAKKRTRRGSRGGRGRKKKTVGTAAEPAAAQEQAEADAEALDPAALEALPEPPEVEAEAPRAPKIHVPADDLGRDEAEAPVGEAAVEIDTPSRDGAAPAKKRTRRGTRGGRNRRKKAPADAAGAATGTESVPAAETEPETEPVSDEGNGEMEWEYVPMSEWEQDIIER